MISLDTETTGLDTYHGARPYLVTVCFDDGEQRFWEWSVDPLTREPKVPRDDVAEIRRLLQVHGGWGKGFDSETAERHVVVGQNVKFDVAALRTIGIEDWPWSQTRDTLLAGHLLASNRPHDLTSMALEYLGVDILPYEKAMEEVVKKCRRLIQQARLRRKRKYKVPTRVEAEILWQSTGVDYGEDVSDNPNDRFADWAIAEAGRPDMPSARETTWKYDGWLPRAMYLAGHPEREESWLTVTSEYANADSAVTVELWKVMKAEIERRGLWEVYLCSLKRSRLAHLLERRGITVNGDTLEELKEEYREESERLGKLCVRIAEGMGYDLKLPKSGNNKSLLTFCFGGRSHSDDEPGMTEPRGATLDLPIRNWSEKGNPSLDKASLDALAVQLPTNSKAALFVRSLRSKRKRDTAGNYLKEYERYWIPCKEESREEARVLPILLGRLQPQELGHGYRSVSQVPGDYSVKKRVRGEGRESRQGVLQSRAAGQGVGWYVLHPSLNCTGTDTLRWSSSNPNSQNISKQEEQCSACEGEGGDCPSCGGKGYSIRSLRHCFGPLPGREWWSLDAKNIELRIPAYLSGEQALIDLLERANDPPFYGSVHLLNFSIVYPEIWEKELKDVGFEKVGPHCKKKYAATYYQWCKNGGFAKQYGGQRRKVDETFRRQGAYDLLDRNLPKLAELNRQCILQANKLGYVETIPDRSVNPHKGYPLLCSRTESGYVLPTVPLNYKVQGSAMWWTARAMERSQELLDVWNALEPEADYAMALQVHDEIVFDFPAGEGNEPWLTNRGKIREIQDVMERGGRDIGVKTPVGVEYHAVSWGEGRTL